MGRKCAVPHCYTGYRKCQEKAPLYRVPDDDYFLSKWQEAIAREDRPITPKDYVCGKHFKEDDILRTRTVKDTVEVYQRPRLKPDAIPSVFPDLPEFIPKMVKKRRKLDQKEDNDEHFASKDITDNDETSEITIKKEIRDGISEETESNSLINKEIEIKSEIDDSIETLSEKDPASVEDPLGEFEKSKGYSKRKKMHYCDHCDYKTKYPHNLRTHQAKHLSGEDAYLRCPHCPDYKTKWELTYRNHLKNKHGMRRVEQEKLRKHIRTQPEEEQQEEEEKQDTSVPSEQFHCMHPGCECEFDTETSLEQHNLVHNSETTEKQKSFKCAECHYETNSKTHILKHIKTVHITGDDTLVSVNAKNFDFSNRRNGKSIYKCLKCPYKTRFHTLLLKHIYRHKNVNVEPDPIPLENKCKVWKCPKCPYATFFEQSMQKHREQECEINTFNCSDCTFSSDCKSDYLKHILTHRDTRAETIRQITNLEEIINGAENSTENMVTNTECVTVKEELQE